MNTLKTTLLMGAMFGLFMLIGGLMGGSGGMVMAFGFAIVMNFSMYWFSDKIVLSMYKAQELPADRAPRIHAIITKIAAGAGIPRPRVYLVPLGVPNAFATGRDPSHAVVAVTKGLLDLLDDREIEGVIAHEIGHIKNRDTLISCLAAAMGGAIMMLASMARWGALLGGLGRDSKNNILELMVMAVIAPLAAMLIQMSISRNREYLADETAARLTRDPQGLSSALLKLQGYSTRYPLKGGNNATSHLFIVNPFSAKSFASMFSTHPPIEDRVRRLGKMTGR